MKTLLATCLLALSVSTAGAQGLGYNAQPDEIEGAKSYTIKEGTVIPTRVYPPEPGTADVTDTRRGRPLNSPLTQLSPVPKMTRKLFRGAHNIVFGWIEIPKNIIEDSSEMDPFSGFFTGLVTGSARTVERMGAGGIEVLTFWHNWPKGYSPIIEPEWVLQEYHDTGR